MGIPILKIRPSRDRPIKIRRSRDRPIFNMGIPIPVRHIYIETDPCSFVTAQIQVCLARQYPSRNKNRDFYFIRESLDEQDAVRY